MDRTCFVARARTTTRAVIVGCCVGLSGCAAIPDYMTVHGGTEPQNEDRNVRFRTTYYFRVYDYCYNANARSKSQPVSDSLYRFVLTGQSNAFANRVRFESGTLKASQIDPFGATVEEDKQTGRLRFVPEAEAQARAQRNEVIEEVRGLVKLKQELLAKNPDGSKAVVGDGITFALDTRIADALNKNLALEFSPSGSGYSPSTTSECKDGSSVRRGFQIMGPQGIKTFDQDDRLVMAMSTESSGLLAALSQVSDRVRSLKSTSHDPNSALLALVREQLTVSEMNRLLAERFPGSASEPPLEATLNEVIDALDEKLEIVTPQGNGQ